MLFEYEIEERQCHPTSGGMLCEQTSDSRDLGGIMDPEPSRFVFEDIAQELSGPLRRYLERLVGNRATADDLLQDTLLKIARALPRFEGRSSVKTWAFTIATGLPPTTFVGRGAGLRWS